MKASDFLDSFAPAAPQKASDFLDNYVSAAGPPTPATISQWHPTLWQKFRTSTVGRKLLGPTEQEQQLMQSGTLAGPPSGESGVLPMLTSLPIVPDVPEMALASRFPTIARGVGNTARGLYAYWAARWGMQQPERFRQVKDQIAAGDWHSATKNMLEDVVEGTMAAGALHGAVQPFFKDIRPAVRLMDGTFAVGDKGQSHNDVMDEHSLKPEDIDRRTFVNLKTGRELSREQLAKLGVKGASDSVPGAHSTGLNEAQQKEANALESKNPQLHGGVRPRDETQGRPQVPAEVSSPEDGQRGSEAVAQKAPIPLEQPGVHELKKVGQMSPMESYDIAKARGFNKGFVNWGKLSPEDKQKFIDENSQTATVDIPQAPPRIKLPPEQERLKTTDLKQGTQFRSKGNQYTVTKVTPTHVDVLGPSGVERQYPIVKTVFQVEKGSVKHPASKTADIIKPEHQQMLDMEKKNVDVPVEPLSEDEIQEQENSEDPFARGKGERYRTNIATIDRDKKRIVVNPKEFNAWMDSIPQSQRQTALRSLIGEERIHLATDDAAAKTYWGNLTGIEKAINVRRYLGAADPDAEAHERQARESVANDPQLMGHEALRFRMQQLARMTPREIAEAVGREKWTVKGLTIVETAVRGIREHIGRTNASKEQIAILNQIQKNLNIGKIVAAGGNPGAINKQVQDQSEKEAQQLEAQAQMYLESGDVESANELKDMAAKLRGQTSEQSFPAAFRKTPPPPGERIVTIRRPDGSTYEASFGGKYWDFTAQGRGRVPSIAVQKEGKWSHGILPVGDEIVEQQSFPGARPKKRHESVFQDKFILPGMEFTSKGAAKYQKEESVVPPEQRVSAEASGALPRLTGAEIQRRGDSWVQAAALASLKANQSGAAASMPDLETFGNAVRAADPKASQEQINAEYARISKEGPPSLDFRSFAEYMKGQEPKLQPGQLFDMWQNAIGGFLGRASGDELQTLAKEEFSQKPGLKSIENVRKKAESNVDKLIKEGELFPDERQREVDLETQRLSRPREGRRSIWDRPVVEKGQTEVVTQYRANETQISRLEQELEQIEPPRVTRNLLHEAIPEELEPALEGLQKPTFNEVFNAASTASRNFDSINNELRLVEGQLANAKSAYYRTDMPLEARGHWRREMVTLQKERNELIKLQKMARASRAWLRKIPEIKYEKREANAQADEIKSKIRYLKRENRGIEDDYKKAITDQSWRTRVTSALWRRFIEEQRKASEPVMNRTSITPEDVRHGGRLAVDPGLAGYQDISKATRPDMERILKADARRSDQDPPNVTRRLIVVRDPRDGKVYIMDAYPRGQDIYVLDPFSPNKEHVPLDSILRRFQPLYSIPLDQPVKSFKQTFGSLAEYQKKLGRQISKDKAAAESYEPTAVSSEEFMQEVGGRMPQSEGGYLQGPERRNVLDTMEGALEQGERTPVTDAEVGAIADRIADAKNASDVEEALRTIDPAKDRQAFSAVAKLGRKISDEYPFKTPDELISTLADRIYDAHKRSKSLAEFNKIIGGETEPEKPAEGLGHPNVVTRDLTTLRSRAPTTTSKKLPPQYFPGAFRKPTIEKSIARRVWDNLFKLNNQREADIRDAFPQLEAVRQMIESMPPNSPKKVSQKLEEETVLGKSDIKLTPNEQKFYDVLANLHAENNELWNELRDIDPTAPPKYWPRMLQDPNSIFERIVRGTKTYVTEGSVVSKGAWFKKPRTIRAIEDYEGNRHIVAIVGKGREQKIVAYDKGQATDMGPYYFKDMMSRYDRLREKAAPLMDEVDRLWDSIHELQRTEERRAASERLLKRKYARLQDLYEQRDNLADMYPNDTLAHRTWVDKNGKEWRVLEATTPEIEANMKARFYHNAFPLLLSQNLKLKQDIRQARWMEDFKKSPEFKLIASVGDEPGRDPTWKKTELPQMRDIWFHPRLAEVFDQFNEQAKRGDPNIWRDINRALQGALFLNQPFLHDPNLLTWWFATRGASSWLNPKAYPRMYRSFQRAFHDVLAKNSDYTNYLRMGAPLQMRMVGFGDTVTRMLMDELESNPPLAKRISNILGYANPVKLMNTVGRAATEGLHDVLSLQLIHELEERGIPPHEAVRKMTAIMPDRRIPPRVMGSRWLSRIMADGNIMWFAAYHYAEGRAFTNMVKGVAGQSQEVSRHEALDKIAAIGLLMFAAYPALDALIREVTGKNYALRRAGPTTWPSAITGVATGRRTPSMVIPSFLSLSPLFTAVPSLFANRNLMNRGLPIYNPRSPASQQAGDIAKFALQQVNPVQMYGDLINGRTTMEDVALNLAGIRRDYSSEPYNKIYGWAYDWARQTGNQKLLNRFNQEANEVYPPSQYTALKRALEDGNTGKAKKEIEKLEKRYPTPEEADTWIERELRPSSHPLSGLEETEDDFYDSLSPQQKKVYDQEMARRDEIYQRYQELSQ